MSGVGNKPEKRDSPFKRALDCVKNFEKIDGTDPQELLKWLGGAQRALAFLSLVLFREEKTRRKPSGLCFLGTASIVELLQYCPRKGLLSLVYHEGGYFLKWVKVKYNTLRIHGDLNDKEIALTNFFFNITGDDTIFLLPYMSKENAIKALRKIAEIKMWVDANYTSYKELVEDLHQSMRKVIRSLGPTEEDLEAYLKKKESNFSAERKPPTEEEIKMAIALSRLSGDTEPETEGIIAEMKFAEKYPTIPLCMTAGNRIIVGVPDGITSEFIYEFKRKAQKKYLKFRLEEARLQVDIYSAMLYRPKKRIQIYIADPSIPDSERFFVIEEDTDPERGQKEILKALSIIDQFESGIIPPRPSNRNKCLNCKFKFRCDALDEKLNANKRENPSRLQETLSF
jgi:CRISPR/Cas system-associated exonuclease Cas4 (RecB family)